MHSEQWEYTGVDTVISGWSRRDTQFNEWLEYLNRMGADGWEMVTDVVFRESGYNGTQYPLIMFKRRIQTQSPG